MAGGIINVACQMCDVHTSLDMHSEMKWIDRAIETGDCHNDEDDGSTWTVFHFGNKCPLDLKSGVSMCKSYADKHGGCKSYICETFARNYLAKHGYDSSSHTVHGKRVDAFVEAGAADVVLCEYTLDERKQYREHVQSMEEKAAQPRDAEQPAKRRRDHRPRSPSGPPPAARNMGGNGGSRQLVCVGRGVAGSSGSRHLVPQGSDNEVRGTASVNMADLVALEGCLERAECSQKLLGDTADFYACQCEDERKIMLEAKAKVTELVMKWLWR